MSATDWKRIAANCSACLEVVRASDKPEWHSPDFWQWMIDATDEVRAALLAEQGPPPSPEALGPERRHGDTGGRLLSEAESREREGGR